MTVSVAVVGAAGRMGRALVAEVVASDLRLVAATEAPGHPALGRDVGEIAGLGPLNLAIVDDPRSAVHAAEVVIDFTSAAHSTRVAELCAEHGVALVVGTTGLDATQRATLQQAARAVGVVWAPNMSVGVNLLFRLVGQAAAALGADYDIEVVESHHRHKRDAPSGTALRLAELLAQASAEAGPLADRARHGRQGQRPREAAEIGIHAIRGGDIVGEHTVLFCTDGERLELTHRAASRRTFTSGALRAVRWIVGREPGLYDMQDVLGLR